MYTEKMGSVQRFTQRSYVGVNSWFNGLNPVEPWWLTWPPLLEIPPPLQLKAWEIHFKHISLSAGLGMGGLNQNCPAIMGTRQGPWTPICERQMTGEFDSYNTPRHDSQMGASSGRICHHNGNVSVYVCVCVCVYASLVRVPVST